MKINSSHEIQNGRFCIFLLDIYLNNINLKDANINYQII